METTACRVKEVHRKYYDTWQRREVLRVFSMDVFQRDHDGQRCEFSCKANQAIPTILFKKELEHFLKVFPKLRMIERKPFSYLAYPLSGGFEGKQLVPSKMYPFLMKAEGYLNFLKEWCACRIFVVLERD